LLTGSTLHTINTNRFNDFSFEKLPDSVTVNIGRRRRSVTRFSEQFAEAYALVVRVN